MLQGPGEAVGRVLGAGEDQDRRHVRPSEELHEEVGLEVAWDGVDGVPNAHGGSRPLADLDGHRLVEDLMDQGED